MLTLGTAAGTGESTFGLWPLFVTSFDVFTVILLAGSLVAVALIVRCVMDVRGIAIREPGQREKLIELIVKGRDTELRDAVRDDTRVMPVAVAACLDRMDLGIDAARDAAELAASHAIGAWFRRLEALNVIGNLGPLVGLAGTVWGMILAFTQLAAGGGEADPSQLSEGISKALFHTLLGLLLAIPCLLVHGLYRSFVERHADAALEDAGAVVETLLANRFGADGSVGDGAKGGEG